MMMKSILRLVSLLGASAVIAVPALASAAVSIGVAVSLGGGGVACNPGDITGIACNFIFIINDVLVPVLFSLAFIIFLWGVAVKYIFSNGDQDKVGEGHRLILWGLIGFVVMISVWGLVNVVSNTLGLSGPSAPCQPTSRGSGC